MISSEEISNISEIIVNNYKPDKVILFGSYAQGTAEENSDLDLMIISDREKSLPRYKRGLKLRIQLSKYPFIKRILLSTPIRSSLSGLIFRIVLCIMFVQRE